jgi:hypothetical protein
MLLQLNDVSQQDGLIFADDPVVFYCHYYQLAAYAFPGLYAKLVPRLDFRTDEVGIRTHLPPLSTARQKGQCQKHIKSALHDSQHAPIVTLSSFSSLFWLYNQVAGRGVANIQGFVGSGLRSRPIATRPNSYFAFTIAIGDA